MNDICRLCLSVPSQIMYQFSLQSEILGKICSCLIIKIPIHGSLPNQVCQDCLEKIEESHSFYKKVEENQNMLYQYLKKSENDLNHFLLSLKNSFRIKEEGKEISALEDKENDNVNICPHTVDDLNKGTLIKYEESGFDHELVEFSSEDDLTLSSLKREKEEENSANTFFLKAQTQKRNCTVKTINKVKGQKSTAFKEKKSAVNDLKNKTENFTNLNDVKHKCLTCFELLHSKNDLLRHYKTQHGHEKDANITTASKTYTVVTIQGNVTFKCDTCHRICDDKRSINRHLMSHEDDRPYNCKICGRTYKTVAEIHRHGRVHSGVRLECSYRCGFSTAYSGCLKLHEKRHNKINFKYKCEKCDRGFQVRTWYEEHQNFHKGVKPFICSICGLAFHMNRYLTAHRSKVHVQSSSVKRYVCMHCSLPCDSRNALTEHLKVHGIKTSFLCDICGKTLSNSEQLKFHKRMHLGVKPYTCRCSSCNIQYRPRPSDTDWKRRAWLCDCAFCKPLPATTCYNYMLTCNKSFTKKFNLKLHGRTHTGERAHECMRCGKRYTQRSSLIRHHMRHHSGCSEKCSKCQKIFASKRQLTAHERLCP